MLHKNYSSENGWSDIFIYNKNIYPRHKKILVISPHHDDSAVSCGATISALSEDNIVNVLVMTAGHHAAISKLTRQQKIKCREKETVAESKVLGHLARFGNFKFYDANKKYWSQDLEKFHSIWQRIKPEIVFLPHPHDEHPTHFLSTELVLDYLDRKKIKNTELWHYEGLWSQHLLNSINIVFGFDNKLLGIKNKSIAKHKSQVKRLPLVKASQALSRFRALTLPEQRFVNFGGEPPKIADYVEAYFRVKY
ncbi:MAG: PIG-L family deacetylase [bacterium]|nr:PIG-L family deacetylase [bacterium]